MGCNTSVEDGDENPQSISLGKSEIGKLFVFLSAIAVTTTNIF